VLEFDSSSAGGGMTNSTVLYWTLDFINSVIKDPEFEVCCPLTVRGQKYSIRTTFEEARPKNIWIF